MMISDNWCYYKNCCFVAVVPVVILKRTYILITVVHATHRLSYTVRAFRKTTLFMPTSPTG